MAYANFTSALSAFIRGQVGTEDREKIVRMYKWENPTLAIVDTDEKGQGSQYEEHLFLDTLSTTANTRSQVQALQQTSAGTMLGKKWVVPWGNLKGGVLLDGDAIMTAKAEAAKGKLADQTVFLDYVKEHTEGAIKSMGRNLEQLLWAGTGASMGSFTISTGVCTFTYEEEVLRFQLGQAIQASDGVAVGSVLLGAGSVGYVIKKDPDNKQITVSTTPDGSAGTPSGWTGTMYAMRYGEFGAGADPTVIIYGLPLWVPTSAPSGAFCGITRTNYPYELGGVRLTSAEAAGGIEKRITRFMTKMDLYGFKMPGGKRKLLMNPYNIEMLATALEAKGVRLNPETDKEFGYSKVTWTGVAGTIEIVSVPLCPRGGAWLVDTKAMRMRSFGKFPQVVDWDGNESRLAAGTDDLEHRLTAKVGFIVRAPGACGYISLPTS